MTGRLALAYFKPQRTQSTRKVRKEHFANSAYFAPSLCVLCGYLSNQPNLDERSPEF